MSKTADEVIHDILRLIQRGVLYFNDSEIVIRKSDSIAIAIYLRGVTFTGKDGFNIKQSKPPSTPPRWYLEIKEDRFIYHPDSARAPAVLSLSGAKLKLWQGQSKLFGPKGTEYLTYYDLHLIISDGLFKLVFNEIQTEEDKLPEEEFVSKYRERQKQFPNRLSYEVQQEQGY